MGRVPAFEEVAHLTLDEAGNCAIALPGSFEELLEVLADDLVDDGLLGAAGPIAPFGVVAGDRR